MTRTKPKAYSDETIAEIRIKYKAGAMAKDLAAEYFVHRNTIYNYCKGIKKR